MGRIQAEIKTSFGKIVIEGSTADELVKMIKSLPENFVNEVEHAISAIFSQSSSGELDNIVRITEDGPILILKDIKAITQYEAIALILYFSESRCNKPSNIRCLLERSGVNLQVSSRINEMAKRGLVFKPVPGKPEWALSPKGERWVEEEVLPKLRKNL
ncbi:MAG: hypothetical protein N3E47_00715 [Candidatus Bathyarchaeota archaeon]|nr:hypothetical protein [Candidatus Bathyarchaeota archaeon]